MPLPSPAFSADTIAHVLLDGMGSSEEMDDRRSAGMAGWREGESDGVRLVYDGVRVALPTADQPDWALARVDVREHATGAWELTMYAINNMAFPVIDCPSAPSPRQGERRCGAPGIGVWPWCVETVEAITPEEDCDAVLHAVGIIEAGLGAPEEHRKHCRPC
jgi:hypothetical protein